ncbi:MAG: 6-phosphofructokinase [Bacillales bacterium]|jgi:6-phosphofructokinase 1|nr:6-phosphofructokinase [Bacillales bacterium]
MEKLIGAALLGQSGGPTSVINSSAAGVFIEALDKDCITHVLAAHHGIKGILEEDFFDISKEDKNELQLLLTTPSSVIGSIRYKLKDPKVDDSEYKRILEVFTKYNIRYFFYNGGNDSMDTCNKISKYINDTGYECRCIGIPKTIDNDLVGTDHCPGYGSAAKYIATTIMELYHDATVYESKQITIVEIMGRNAGWLTAASCLANIRGCGPDLVYLPEKPFDMEQFYQQVTHVVDNKGKCIICVSEGIKTKEGKYIPELYSKLAKDSFGHAQLGGTAVCLARELGKRTTVKIRAIELSLLQRCAAHLASKTDVIEAFNAGAEAVKAAINGKTDVMVSFDRPFSDPYIINYDLISLNEVANKEKTVPLGWIKYDNSGMTNEFYNYALPLIQGELKAPLESGLPKFARLRRLNYRIKE